MKELVILSGKGGTGKTSIASSFISLSRSLAFADCDVDAPNLHLLMDFQNQPSLADYFGMDKAYIDSSCIGCGKCKEYCKFGAVDFQDGNYIVDPYACESCGLCLEICPSKSIKMLENKAGDLKLYRDGRTFSTAELKMGQGNSGLLVSEVKKKLRENIEEDQLVIVDGSPGIGCPVIASMNTASMVLLVAEPSVAGFSDLKRIVNLTRPFDFKLGVLINKYDLDLELRDKIEEYLKEEKIALLGMIPFDEDAGKLLSHGKGLLESSSKTRDALVESFYKTMKMMEVEI